MIGARAYLLQMCWIVPKQAKREAGPLAGTAAGKPFPGGRWSPRPQGCRAGLRLRGGYELQPKSTPETLGGILTVFWIGNEPGQGLTLTMQFEPDTCPWAAMV